MKKTPAVGGAAADSTSTTEEEPKKIYFYTGFIAYISGLLLTIFIMHVYKHAQPALLYLVPACVGAPILVATLRGELTTLFSYDDGALTEGGADATTTSQETKKD